MATPKAVLINGQAYGWSSIQVNIAGVDIIGITAVSYSDSQDIEPVYGVGTAPIAVGMGPITFEGSLTLLAEEVDRLELASPNGRIQELPLFDVIVQFDTGVGNLKVHRLQNCRFKNNGRESSQGDTQIEVELELFNGRVKFNVA